MVPKIVRVVHDPELQLALALCMLHHNPKTGIVEKRGALVPDEVYKSLSSRNEEYFCPLIKSASRYRLTVELKRAISGNQTMKDELMTFVSNPRFAETRRAWKLAYEAEFAKHKKSINTSFAAANEATRHMSRESHPRSFRAY